MIVVAVNSLLFSAVVMRPIRIGFPSFECRDERPPWSDLAVGVAEFPKTSSHEFFCFVFTLVFPWCEASHPSCSAAVSGPTFIDFPSSEGCGELRPWSDLAVGIAECPKTSSHEFFCFDFTLFCPWCEASCPPIAPRQCRGQLLLTSPPSKAVASCGHG